MSGRTNEIWRIDSRHAHWPALWREIHDPPATVSGTGDGVSLTGPLLAIVGTRRASNRGLAVAAALAAGLARSGWTIVSGLARGVDAAAHRGALEAGGRTVAVMASGIDRTYPSEHAALRRRIEAAGCVVTEEADGAPPLRYAFPKRNRLVAGMARGVLVVEAPRRSGALLTAMQSADMGREVFAVPGPLDGDLYGGCHRLIKEGATLVEGLDDVHAVLPPPSPPSGTAGLDLPSPGTVERWIWDRLDLSGLRLSELRRMWAGTESVFAAGLSALEIAGLIRRLPGNRVARSIWTP